MGLLDNQTQEIYYTEDNNKGAYQFTSMNNIISAFMVAYVGEDKIISKVNRTDVQFHAMRAIQELSYDVFRSVKSQEIEIANTLRMPLPQDYVNYIKIVKVGNDGIERILYPTGKTSNPFAIEQSANGNYNYIDNTDMRGDVLQEGDLQEQGNINTFTTAFGAEISAPNTNTPFASDTLTNYHDQTEASSSDSLTDIEIDNYGRRYGLDPQHAQKNGTFFIDQRTGWIFFGSSLAGETVTLKYVSDGLGDDHEMIVHKFCEEACYKWIAYAILSTRSNIPEYIVQRYKKEKFAETRKAKIRLSNIKIEEFTQVIKGMSKQIK